jgi:chorismate mutase
MESWQEDLKIQRDTIDFCDDKILKDIRQIAFMQNRIKSLLLMREQSCREIAIIKKEHNLLIYDAERENEVMAKYREEHADFVKKILAESHKIQQEVIDSK